MKTKKLKKNKTELTKAENELSKSKLDSKEMETEVGKLKKEKQLQHKFELFNYMQLHISI